MLRNRQQDVRHLRGRLAGATVFVLGNGPSVREHDLARLQGLHVIGMNASPLLDREYGFRSDYYVVSDTRFLSHPEKRIYATAAYLAPETIRIFREELRGMDARDLAGSTYYVHAIGKNGFSEDLARGYYFGCTTSMLALQLAAYLGCRRIVLIGNDFRYPKDQPRFYRERNPQDHDPFLSVQLWNIRNAYRWLRARGIELCICTRSSNLVPYIPHIPFDDLVDQAHNQKAMPSRSR